MLVYSQIDCDIVTVYQRVYSHCTRETRETERTERSRGSRRGTATARSRSSPGGASTSRSRSRVPFKVSRFSSGHVHRRVRDLSDISRPHPQRKHLRRRVQGATLCTRLLYLLTYGGCSPFYAALHDPSRIFTPVNVTRDNYKC